MNVVRVEVVLEVFVETDAGDLVRFLAKDCFLSFRYSVCFLDVSYHQGG